MIISIVGLSGSGKSFVARTLESYNPRIIHLDIDKIGHSVYESQLVRQNLLNTFGEMVLKDNQVDRKALGKIVFSNPNEMKKLEDITWSYMEAQIDAFIASNKDKIILLDWLLLPKTKYFKECDLRIMITADQQTRMKRALERDNITEEEFLRRDNAASELNPNDFEYIINNQSIEKTQEEVKLIYDKSIIHR